MGKALVEVEFGSQGFTKLTKRVPILITKNDKIGTNYRNKMLSGGKKLLVPKELSVRD